MLEDHAEELERRTGGEEVLHVGVPRAVEARNERKLGVAVEEHEPRFVDRRDGHAVFTWPVSRRLLQVAECSPQRLTLARLDTEEQAELGRRADAETRPGRSCSSCRHSFPPLDAGIRHIVTQ